MYTHDYTFRAATPVWEKGTARVMNRTVCFVATLPATDKPVTLAAAASCAKIALEGTTLPDVDQIEALVEKIKIEKIR